MQKFCFTLLFLLTVIGLNAQQYTSDSAITRTAIDYAKHLYFTQRDGESAIYNGVHHLGYLSSIEGFAYFPSRGLQKGYVIYNNIRYENVLMKYDAAEDQLIVTPGEQDGTLITLFSPRVKEFSFSNFNFIRIDKTEQNGSLVPGFYQELAHGKLTALAKRSKVISEKNEGIVSVSRFEETSKYYLLKDGISYPVKRKKDILTFVKDKQTEVRRFLSKNKLNYRKNPEETIIAATEFYNQPGY